MARPLRIAYPGAVYHGTGRGNERQPICRTAADRTAFLETRARGVRRDQWRCHAYCLMDNYYHLLIEAPDANRSRGRRQVNGIYTQGCNRRHQRIGHLWQGRFQAVLPQKDRPLLAACRDVVRNPVRAQAVAAPGLARE